MTAIVQRLAAVVSLKTVDRLPWKRGRGPRRVWLLVPEESSDTLIGRQIGIGGNQLHQAICLEDRLHQRFSEFDGGDLTTTLHTLEMGIGGQRTATATAPPSTVQGFLHHQLVNPGRVDRRNSCRQTEYR